MKKKFSIILIFILVIAIFSLSACGTLDSAYIQAVNGGFTGTYAEWLASSGSNNNQNGNVSALDAMYNKAVTNGFVGTFEEWMSTVYGVSSSGNIETVSSATNKAIISAVCVYSNFTSKPSRVSASSTFTSAGSGVIFYENGDDVYIITNYHVIYDASSVEGISQNIEVFLYGMLYSGMEYNATFVGGSMENDIAVLKIVKDAKYKSSAAKPATVGNSLALSAGDTAIAIGNPNAEGVSATSGIVSVESEQITMTGADDVTSVTFKVVRIDTPVNSGNSGGGLFNIKGELVGIVNAKYNATDTENIGYAIPSSIAVNLAYRIIEQSNNKQSLYKVIFGMTMKVSESTSVYDELTNKAYIKQKIVLDEIVSGSASDGYLKVNDVMVSFTYDGETTSINRLYTVTDYIFKFKQYDNIVFTVVRDGVTMDVTVPMNNVVNVK